MSSFAGWKKEDNIRHLRCRKPKPITCKKKIVITDSLINNLNEKNTELKSPVSNKNILDLEFELVAFSAVVQNS